MLTLLILIVLVGLGLYLVETYVPMAPPIKIILRVVVILLLLVYVARLFGVAVP